MGDRERQLEREESQRSRVAISSIAAGLLLFAGELYNLTLTLKAPRVGLIQGLAPGLKGTPLAAQDPHTQSEIFTNHHAVGLIVAIVALALGLAAMAPVLSYLADAVRLRRPEGSDLTRRAARVVPITAGVFAVAAEVAYVIAAHHFVTHADRSHHAIDVATKSSLQLVLGTIAAVSQYGLAIIIALTAYQAMRVGLLTRFLGVMGVIGGILFIIPFTPLPVVQTFWLVALGVVLQGYGNSVLPPAWAAGEARPWPTQQEMREARERERGGGSVAAEPAPAPSVPTQPSPHASKKRKRRR
jgi:hypothetical protein